MKKYFIIPATLALVACAGQQYLAAEKQSGDSIDCAYDKFDKTTYCHTGYDNKIFQRIDKSSAPYIYVKAYKSAFGPSDRAKDINGKSLNFRVHGGFVDTTGYVTLPSGYLEKHLNDGISIRITDGADTTSVHKSPEEIKEHLDGMKLIREADLQCYEINDSIHCKVCGSGLLITNEQRAERCPQEKTIEMRKKMGLN